MMADIETNLTTAGIATALIALKEIGMGIWKTLRKGNADRKREREEAKTENGERDQWVAINDLRKDFQQHRLDDAQSFASLESEQKHSSEILREIKADVKIVLRRSTGKHNE